MTDPRSDRALAKLRTHLWTTPLAVALVAWPFRASPVSLLLFLVGLGLTYYVGLGGLYAWAWRRPDVALGGVPDLRGSSERVVRIVLVGIGVFAVLLALGGILSFDASTPRRSAEAAAAFRWRLPLGCGLLVVVASLSYVRGRSTPRSLEFFRAAALGLTLSMLGVTALGAFSFTTSMLASDTLRAPQIIGLTDWTLSPVKGFAVREYVSSDGTQVLLVVRSTGKEQACDVTKVLPFARLNREARAEQQRALPDTGELRCRVGAVLVARDGQENVEIGRRPCANAEGSYLYAYRWTGDRTLRPEDLPNHLGCAPGSVAEEGQTR